jgi:glycosyltransferase involved in cell wall biosynthesis
MGEHTNHAQRQECRGIGGLELFESGHKLEWMDDPWDDVACAGDWLLDLESRVRPDVIHLNGYCHGAQPFTAPVLVAAHSCVFSWWKAVNGEPPPPQWDRYRGEVIRGLAAASLVVAPTRAMLDALEKHYGALRRKAVVPNGRNIEFRTGFPKEPLVFSSGRIWDSAKNISALDKASQRISWPVYVAGDNRHPNGGLAHIGKLRLLGSLPRKSVEWWMSRAGIYALPARYEPFGLSVLEAALGGCALVVGDIPSLREIWDGCASFIAPDDADALAGAINELIDHPQRRIDLANRARQHALSYGRELMTGRYLAAYNLLQN